MKKNSVLSDSAQYGELVFLNAVLCITFSASLFLFRCCDITEITLNTKSANLKRASHKSANVEMNLLKVKMN